MVYDISFQIIVRTATQNTIPTMSNKLVRTGSPTQKPVNIQPKRRHSAIKKSPNNTANRVFENTNG